MKNIIKDIGTFVYGFTATLFCWAAIIVGGFAVVLAYEVGAYADPLDILIIFVGSAVGVSGICGFYSFLVEEKLMEDYFGVSPKE